MSVVPQLLDTVKGAGTLGTSWLMVELPVLVKVSGSELPIPTGTDPKFRKPGVIESCGAAFMPLPVSATDRADDAVDV